MIRVTAVFKNGNFIGHVVWSGRKCEAPVNNTYLCNHIYYAQNLPITEFYLTQAMQADQGDNHD